MEEKIEDNFDFYLIKNWYFEILSSHLRNAKNYN